MTDLASNILRVRETIARAAERSGRPAESVKLVAASKTVPADAVAAAAGCGIKDFGENFVQEAGPKIGVVAGQTDQPIHWHMVGHLQSNKVKQALGLFDMIQSVDSIRLAEQISRRASPRRVPILLELYLGEEPERPGFRLDEVDSALGAIQSLGGVEVRGLMTVPPLGLSLDDTRRVFVQVRAVRERLAARFPDLDLPELSMGMTDDYPVAVEEGATIVRVGRAIFGERPV